MFYNYNKTKDFAFHFCHVFFLIENVILHPNPIFTITRYPNALNQRLFIAAYVYIPMDD